MNNKTCEAIGRLESWVREYGDRSQPPFLADLKTVIEAAKGEQRAELVARFAVAIVGSDYDGPGARFEPATVWQMAAEYVDAKPQTVLAICDGCNTQLPSNVQRLCPECAKTLDALSEYVKQRSEMNRER